MRGEAFRLYGIQRQHKFTVKNKFLYCHMRERESEFLIDYEMCRHIQCLSGTEVSQCRAAERNKKRPRTSMKTLYQSWPTSYEYTLI